jgi:cardiolipin synthase
MRLSRRFALWGLLALLLLSGCAAPAPPRVAAQTAAQPVIEPDDGRQPLLDAIGGAQSSIDVAIYELTDSRIAAALEAAAARGVTVRVLAEPKPGGRAANARTLSELASKGVQTESSAPGFYYTHEKAMVFDGATAWIMSMNLVAETFDNTRDVALLDTNPTDVAEVESVFQADWNREPATVSDSALVWSPENARARLLALLSSASSSIDIYAEELTDHEVESALTDAVGRGVQVRLLMTDSGTRDPARPARSQLIAAGGQVRLLEKPYIHAKVVIVDGGRAFAGSENFTATSLDQNRELGLLTSDPDAVSRLSASFNQDWQQAKPAS